VSFEESFGFSTVFLRQLLRYFSSIHTTPKITLVWKAQKAHYLAVSPGEVRCKRKRKGKLPCRHIQTLQPPPFPRRCRTSGTPAATAAPPDPSPPHFQTPTLPPSPDAGAAPRHPRPPPRPYQAAATAHVASVDGGGRWYPPRYSRSLQSSTASLSISVM
jgi:hypothetical protein